MSRFILGRRTVLRGMGGAAVALPALEIMGQKRARGAVCEIPKRFVLAYGGVSIGGYLPTEQNLVIPKTTGRNWVPSRGLAPIAHPTYDNPDGTKIQGNVKSEVAVISGLKVPIGNPTPPGGRSSAAGFHGTSLRPQLSGEAMDGEGEVGRAEPRGSTSDQIVAGAIKGPTPYASIDVSIQADGYVIYNGNHGGADGFSYRDGRLNRAISSPRQVYNALFSEGGVVNGKTFDVAAFIDRRKSVLDAVLEKSERLRKRLGGEDLRRLDQHYTEIRGLEKSLESLKAKSGTMACSPADPPTDPPVGNAFDYDQARVKDCFNLSPEYAWSNEELRAQVMVDLMHVALACDLTRSVGLSITESQCYLNGIHVVASKKSVDFHGIGHQGSIGVAGLEDMADVVAWHVKHFSRFVAKLRDTVECDGTRLLDHTAMALLFEGGHGYVSPERGWDSHSTENMIAVVAGGAGGLKCGQHIHFDNDRQHPAQVVLSCMNAVGIGAGQRLGDITEPLPEMFRWP